VPIRSAVSVAGQRGRQHYTAAHAEHRHDQQHDRRLNNTFDRFARQYRERNLWAVNISLGFQHLFPVYVPELPPLERGATPEDVKTGKAIFHLDGKGIPVALVLPALGQLKDVGAQADDGPRLVVIVQAEAAADGAVTYGVIGKNFMRAVSQKDVPDVKPLAQAVKGQ